MKITLHHSPFSEIQIAFDLLKSASQKLERKDINQWHYWQNPPQEKIDWVRAGFEAKEFYWIKNVANELMGMVRILDEDLLYWGAQNEKAKYIHSLVIREKFSGQKVGEQVIDLIKKDAKEKGVKHLRLDCDASNNQLCDYYLKQGFEKVGVKTLPLGTYNLYQKTTK